MRKILIPLALLAGGVGGFIRANEWHWAWDKTDGLMIPYHFLSILLLGFSFVFLLLVVAIVRSAPAQPEVTRSEATDFRPAQWLGWAEGLAILALLAGAVLDAHGFIVAQTPNTQIKGLSTLIFAVLSILACICMIVIVQAAGRGALGRAYGIYMLVPVFWACFWLIRNIGTYAINPVPLSFFYDMMCTIFALLSLYASAGFFFGQARIRRAIAYSMMGIYFALVTLLGPGLHWLQWGTLPLEGFQVGDLFRFGFVLLHLTVILHMAGVGIPKSSSLIRRNRTAEM